MTDLREINKELSDLKQSFTEAIQLFETEQTAESIEKTSDVLGKTKSLIDHLAQGYKQALFDHKFQSLSSDITKAESLRAKKSPNESAKDLMKILVHAERAIGRLEKEIGHVYPQPSKIWSFAKKNWPIFAGVVGIFLIGAFISKQVADRHGLLGEYYNDVNFERIFKTRVDHKIDFIWGFDGPFSKQDNFAVRWTGFLDVPADGPYDFSIASDDGARLLIDGQVLVDDWAFHPMQTKTATMTLTKATHPIRLEFYELTRHAQIQLFWKKPASVNQGSQSEIIPAKNLIPYRQYIKHS